MGTIASALQWYCIACNYLNPTESVRCLRCRKLRRVNGVDIVHHQIRSVAEVPRQAATCVRMKDVNRKLVTNDCLFRVIDSLALAHKNINRKKIERSFAQPQADRYCWSRRRHLSQPSINRRWSCHRCRLYNRSVSWHCINCETLSLIAPVYKDTIKKSLTQLIRRGTDDHHGCGLCAIASIKATSMEQLWAARCRFCLYNQFNFEGDRSSCCGVGASESRLPRCQHSSTDSTVRTNGGITDQLIETSSQKGRSGLGMKLDQLDTAAAHWDAKAEQLQIPETVVWLTHVPKINEPELSRDQLDEWHKVGPPKMTIDNEDKYCDTEILQQVLKSKSVFDNLGNEDMRKARYRSNPFELIKSNIFINRAAVKMANMDAMFDYMFTHPTDEQNQPLVKDEARDLFYFADVCAGPGGFSEYVLWRNKWRAKGFGFTLRGANDFRLDGFTAGGPETFDPYYGPKDNGDIFDPENISSFADYVMKQTETGVHLMMADGGFSVEGHENEQKIYSKQLYLCQVIVALAIVRPGGNFVVKLFDIFTPFSVGLIYLVYRCFRQICICKPNSSRPANSERYLVCKSKNPNTGTIERYLQDINRQMFEKRNANNDTLELVNEAVMRKDETFYDYICASNNEIGGKQIIALMKIAAFCKNRDLMEKRQLEVKQKCLDLWKLDDAIRKSANKGDPDQYVTKIYKNWNALTKPMLSVEARVQTDLRASFSSARDWYFVPIGNKESKDKNVRSILLGKGGKEVYQFDAKHGTWILMKDVAIELSPATIIYGEIVRELQGEGRSQIVIHTLHIIDGLMLGGENIGHLTLKQRLERCHQFAKALNKPIKNATTTASSTSTCANSTGSMQIRAKKHYPLSEMESFFASLEMHKLKDLTSRLGYNVRNPIDQDRFYIPYGLLFLRDVKPHYSKQLSKQWNMEYYFNSNTGESKYPEKFKNFIEETQATFDETFDKRIFWEWIHLYQVQQNVDEKCDKIPNIVHRVDFKKYLKEAYPS